MNRLLTLLAALDDAALEALASKGLLRRAQKDLERLQPAIVPSEAGLLTVKIESFTVTIPDAGPARGTCTCPATNVCQHILTACLFLRTQAATNVPDATASDAAPGDPVARGREELLALTLDHFNAWAGKPVVRAALALVASQPVVEFEEKAGLIRIHLPAFNAECRFLPGAGLDGMVISGPLRERRKLAVAALLLYQQSHGVALPAEASTAAALEEAAGAPRTRDEILASAGALLQECVAAGLAHLSPAIEQRFATLAVSALGVNLPRLALALRALSDETGLLLRREARSDTARLLSALARTFALGEALAHARPAAPAALVGWHRTRYDDIGTLDLAGVGAWQWQTGSGFDGITALFWDLRGAQWLTWSEARPRHLGGFKPSERYRQDGPWAGATSPEQISRSQFKLNHARRNPAGRLSASGKSRAVVLGPTPRLDFGAKSFTSWAALVEHVAQHTAIGLVEPAPLADLIVARPAAWGRRQFDPVTQEFRWEISDAEGETLPLHVRYDAVQEPVIRALEQLDPAGAGVTGVVARVLRAEGEFRLQPHSLLSENETATRVTNLCFDLLPIPTSAASVTTGSGPGDHDELEIEEEMTEPAVVPSGLLDHRLADLEDRLAAAAESGVAGANALWTDAIVAQAPRLEAAGLSLLGQAVRDFALDGSTRAAALLRLVWLCHLHHATAGAMVVSTRHPPT